MASSSTPLSRGAATPAPPKGLRLVRNLLVAIVAACAIVLPFQLGVLSAAKMPVVGTMFASPTPPAVTVVAVQNSPRTAIIGGTERFSVRLSGLPHAALTYVLRYPDGTTQKATVHTDAQGYSSYTFHLTGYTMKHFREENASLSVQNAAGTVLAAELFAVQKK